MPRVRHAVRGAYVACGMLLLCAAAWLVQAGLSYDGVCGGYFPGLSARTPCSLRDYVFGDALAIGLVVAEAVWPVVLAFVAVPPLVGWWLDRRKRRQAA